MTPSPPPPRAGLFSPLHSNGSPVSAAWCGGPPRGRRRLGIVPTTPLITLPPPREVARPEISRDSMPAAGWVDEEEWVTIFGFLPGDTNLVLREFEKCGIVLRHVPGPRDANWMHTLYQSRHDAQKALAKHGQQLNTVLIIGVKQVDPGSDLI